MQTTLCKTVRIDWKKEARFTTPAWTTVLNHEINNQPQTWVDACCVCEPGSRKLQVNIFGAQSCDNQKLK